MRIFSLFSGSTLKASRKIINEMFNLGLHPVDFLLKDKNIINKFQDTFTSKRLIVFDTETTGLNVEKDDIIQIAATEIINGNSGKSINIYIKTNKSLSETVKIHNINLNLLNENGIPAKTGIKKFLNFIGNDALLAHNSNYDINILTHFSNRYGMQFDTNRIIFDSIELTKRLYPKLKSYKLGNILNELNIEGNATHNAIDDVFATISLVNYLNNKNNKNKLKRVEFLQKNKKLITRFNKNISNFWTRKENNLIENYSIKHIIDDFIEIWSKPLNIEENNSINKLKRYLIKMRVENSTLKEFLLDQMPIISRFKEADLIIGDEAVVISTIHRAKGLEWDTVIIPSCNDDNYPSFYSKEDAKKPENNSSEIMLEQAKVLYVAITRTKKKLIISQNKYFLSLTGFCFNKSLSRFIKPILHHFN
ncbi:MAG: ATP-binding domain-containing protein [Candidatus Marinimicrobia bacterium]|nr:ATP-binding domain-containing protein [Candidatus Neomarinimicrobiota bacterium]